MYDIGIYLTEHIKLQHFEVRSPLLNIIRDLPISMYVMTELG